VRIGVSTEPHTLKNSERKKSRPKAAEKCVFCSLLDRVDFFTDFEPLFFESVDFALKFPVLLGGGSHFLGALGVELGVRKKRFELFEALVFGGELFLETLLARKKRFF